MSDKNPSYRLKKKKLGLDQIIESSAQNADDETAHDYVAEMAYVQRLFNETKDDLVIIHIIFSC